MHTFFIHSSIVGHLGCFQVLAITNNTAINIAECFQGPVEEQTKGEYEQRSQDHEGLIHPLRQCTRTNGNSPKPTGLGLNEHVIKLDPLNVADNGAD